MRKRYFGSILRRFRRNGKPLPNYYVSWTDAAGKRRVKVAGDREAAERLLLALQAEREALLPAGRRRRRDAALDERAVATFSTLSGAVLTVWKGTLAAGTLRHRPTFLRRWGVRLGELPVSVVTTLDVQRLVNRMRLPKAEGGEGLAASSIQAEVGVLSAAFRTLHRDLGIPIQNPVRDLALPRIHQRRRPHLKPLDVRALLATCSPKILGMVVVLAEAGLRPAEVFRLTWAEVSFELGVLRLERTKTYQVRTVVMTPLVRRALEEAWRAAPREKDENPAPRERVFPLGENAFRKHFRKAVKAAGLRDVTPYTLRHAYASTLLQAGAPVSVVRDALGHANIRTTDRYVRSLAADAQRLAMEAFVRVRGTGGGVPEEAAAAGAEEE